MNREIKFRGKLLKDSESFKTYKKGTIIEGGYWKQGDKHFIVAHFNVFEVEPDSVGQFTGLITGKKQDLFEGDIFNYTEHVGYLYDDFQGEVKFEDGCLGFKIITGQVYRNFIPFSEIDDLQHDFLNHIEIVGRTFDSGS